MKKLSKIDVFTLMVGFAVLCSAITFGFFHYQQIATVALLACGLIGAVLYTWERFSPAAEGSLRSKINLYVRLPGIVLLTCMMAGFLTVSLFVNPIIWCVAAGYFLLVGGITLLASKTAEASAPTPSPTPVDIPVPGTHA